MYVPIILTLVTCHFFVELVTLSQYFTVLFPCTVLYWSYSLLAGVIYIYSHSWIMCPTLGAMLIRLSLRSPSTVVVVVVGVYLHVHGTSMYGGRQVSGSVTVRLHFTVVVAVRGPSMQRVNSCKSSILLGTLV